MKRAGDGGREDRILRLRDGRNLGYADYGPPWGEPLLYLHGFPASRLEGALAAPAAVRLGLRVIAPDRPGIGLSDYQRGRTLADWPEDVAELADHLDLERFGVLAVSGGGPYACAVLARLPRRVTRAVLVCPMGELTRHRDTRGMVPTNRLLLLLYRHCPPAARPLVEILARGMRRRPERAFEILAGAAPEPDRQVLEDPVVSELLTASYREALRTALRGVAREVRLLSRLWNIPLAPSPVPVHIWHGGRDTTVPPAMGRALAEALGAVWHFIPEEGHFSLPVRQMEKVLAPFAGTHSDSPDIF